MYQYFDGTKFFDRGCIDADNVIGGKSACTECPFRQCIADLRGREKQFVLAASSIRQVYNLYDEKGKIGDVSQALGLPYARVYNWISNRPQIEKKLNDYAIISV